MNIRTLALVAMITAFAPLSMDLYLPGLPDLRNEFGASNAAAHLTVTGCIVGLALGQFVTGLLPERLGRKRPLILGMLIWICATIACSLAPAIWVVTSLRVVQGLGAGVAIALARSVIADLDPENLAEHLSRMMLVLSVVPILAPALGGLALSFTSWRGLFLCLAVVGVVLLLVIRRFLPESRPPREVEDEVDGGFRQIVMLARKPAFLLPAIVSGAGFGVMFSYISDSAFVFRDHYGMDAAVYGVLFGVNACALISGFQVGPFLNRRWGTRRVLLVASGTGALGGTGMVAAAFQFPTTVAPVVASLMLVLASAGILIPIATAAAIDAHPQHVGGASGLSGALQFMMGGTLATLPVALQLGDGAGPLGAACTACLVGAWLLVLLFMTERDDEVAATVLPTVVPIHAGGATDEFTSQRGGLPAQTCSSGCVAPDVAAPGA